MEEKQLGRLTPLGGRYVVNEVSQNLIAIDYHKRGDEQPSDSIFLTTERALELRDWLIEWLGGCGK